MTDGKFWRHLLLAFTARGPYDPSGRDQEIARLSAAIARLEDPESEPVRALREALEYRRDGFPNVASHIQDRLDIVQAAVDELRGPNR